MNKLESGLKIAALLQQLCELSSEEDAVMMEALRQLQVDGFYRSVVLDVRLKHPPGDAANELLRHMLGADARLVGVAVASQTVRALRSLATLGRTQLWMMLDTVSKLSAEDSGLTDEGRQIVADAAKALS